jgi:hypothetical protein
MVEPMTTLPENWVPSTKVARNLASEYGREVDLRLVLQKFRAFYAEGQTSRNWDARFVVWVIRDVQQIREKNKGGTDDLGTPFNQSADQRTALQPGDEGYVSIDDLAAEAAEVARLRRDEPC